MPLSDDLRELYQKVILDHSRSPRNHGKLSPESCLHIHADNPSCGDEVDLYLRFSEDGTCIREILFEGQGCAISQASASMMTEKVTGISREEIARLIQDIARVVQGDVPPTHPESLGELQALEAVQKFPQRSKCALLGWNALEKALGVGK
jgi:nitrogen fixation protein NifU and related proteins